MSDKLAGVSKRKIVGPERERERERETEEEGRKH